jgi:hypothetical protein
LQPDLHRQARNSGKVTASRLIRAALNTCGTSGVSGGNPPHVDADVAHVAAKTELLRLRLMEKKRALVRQSDVDELIDQIAGITLTHLSGMAARCSRDMVVRRNIDAAVMQIRREIAEACSKAADAADEPPLDEQG